VPDLKVLNAGEYPTDGLDAALATAAWNGTIYWSRPGMLNVMCKFSGLVAFPYDKLKCAMEISGWSFSSDFQGITLKDGIGYTLNSKDITSGSSYQEFQIIAVDIQITMQSRTASPLDHWQTATYLVTLDRALFYYWILVLLPSTLLTVLSFGVFFVASNEGERLGYSITIIIAGEVSKMWFVSLYQFAGSCFGWMSTCSYAPFLRVWAWWNHFSFIS